MKIRATILTIALLGGFQLSLVSTASAHDKFENLKILKDNGKDLEKGMKGISKGLGVKCKACHVKGEFQSDKVPAKNKTREFFKAAVGEKDEAKKKAALDMLLKVMKKDKLKKPDKFWKGMGKFQKK